MFKTLLFSLMFLAMPEQTVIVLKNGFVIENPTDCQTRGGFLEFTDRHGNRFRIPEDLIAFSGPVPSVHPTAKEPSLEPISPLESEVRSNWTNPLTEPKKEAVVITDETLTAYAGAAGVRVLEMVNPSQIEPVGRNPQKTSGKETLEAQKKLNAKYRKKTRTMRERIERIKDRIRRVEDGLFLIMAADDRNKLKERRNKLKQELDQAVNELKEIRREARRKGAKPRNF